MIPEKKNSISVFYIFDKKKLKTNIRKSLHNPTKIFKNENFVIELIILLFLTDYGFLRC